MFQIIYSKKAVNGIIIDIIDIIDIGNRGQIYKGV